MFTIFSYAYTILSDVHYLIILADCIHILFYNYAD